MRAFRDNLTIVNGQTASNAFLLGHEKLVGLFVKQAAGGGGGTDLRFQALVSGSLDGPAADQVWADISLTTTDNPPTGGYVTFTFKVAFAEITLNKIIIFPRPQCAFIPAVIRVVTQAAVTGASLIVQAITDSHA